MLVICFCLCWNVGSYLSEQKHGTIFCVELSTPTPSSGGPVALLHALASAGEARGRTKGKEKERGMEEGWWYGVC